MKSINDIRFFFLYVVVGSVTGDRRTINERFCTLVTTALQTDARVL